MMTLKDAAQNALDVQDACNLSGVAITFADVMRCLCEHVQTGTYNRNNHPIAVLFTNKMANLAGQHAEGNGATAYGAAYDACQALARGED